MAGSVEKAPELTLEQKFVAKYSTELAHLRRKIDWTKVEVNGNNPKAKELAVETAINHLILNILTKKLSPEEVEGKEEKELIDSKNGRTLRNIIKGLLSSK